ncbi:unnamed protein product [Effrenium voratum]|nr:unnamed protein product [Effrenium voratum]
MRLFCSYGGDEPAQPSDIESRVFCSAPAAWPELHALHFLGLRAVTSFDATLGSRLGLVVSMATANGSTGSRTALEEVDTKGSFKRVDSAWRSSIEEGGRFSPASGRYHLYIALACPWADGVLAALFMKGLEDCIGYSVTHPTWQRSRPERTEDQHLGWAFRKVGDPPLANALGYGGFECDDALVPDLVNGAQFVRDLYEKAGDTAGKYSTPVLWDKEEGTIVNNESMEILRMLNSKFNKWAKNPDLDLFPASLATEADAANAWVYPSINNGVYRCGFAKSQEAYDIAVKELSEALARAETLLSKQRYVCGDTFTFMDLRLFMTLVRFDAVYVVYFKTNVGTIEHDYPNLLEYCRDVYQMPGVAKAINMRHIKMHYFTSHPDLNKFGIIPRGRDVDFSAPHKRQKLTKSA